jgi:hypothetical protein
VEKGGVERRGARNEGEAGRAELGGLGVRGSVWF